MSTSASSADSWDTARVQFPTLPKPSHISLQEALESQPRLSGLLIADSNGLLINGKRRPLRRRWLPRLTDRCCSQPKATSPGTMRRAAAVPPATSPRW